MEQPATTRQQLIQRLRAMGNKLRIDSVIATTEAGSGHPTSCLSAADLMAAVFFHAMRFDVANPHNGTNDRFVLSKGHAAPILYAAWAEAGAFPVERLKTLRQFGSDLEGHPTPRLPWVDVATGSLGQGLSNGAGMALNAKYLDHIDYRVYVLLGDGEAAEGSVWEAAEFASYYKLDNLVGIIDVNGLGQSQQTMYGHHTDVYRRRFEAFGWHALSIDGHDMDQIVDALDEAAGVKDKPTMIVASTIKGKGISFVADLNGWHGKALKKGEETDRALAEIKSNDLVTEGLKMLPPTGRTANEVIEGAAAAKIEVGEHYKTGESVATREAYGEALARLGARNPLVVVLDGDVKNSTFSEKFLKAFPDRFFECFIAEQNMVGTAAGLSAMGKIPFASTFACFLTRAFDQIRMGAISLSNIKLCGSHAGVSIGEDGPSQMALEDLAMMRAVETATVLYPSDAISTEYAVQLSAANHGIFYIRTSRPKTPVIYKRDDRFEIGKCKVIRTSKDDRITVVAAGVTLFEALKAYDELKGQGISIRVVDIFSVKPIDVKGLESAGRETGNLILTVEDHSLGGIGDAVAGAVSQAGIRVHELLVSELPRSGKPEELLKAYGIDSSAIISAVKSLVAAG